MAKLRMRIKKSEMIEQTCFECLMAFNDRIKRLEDAKKKKNGSWSEITKRISSLVYLRDFCMWRRRMGTDISSRDEEIVDFIVSNGINTSLLSGGQGYPRIEGYLFNLACELMPSRTRDIKRMMGDRANIQADRNQRLSTKHRGKKIRRLL